MSSETKSEGVYPPNHMQISLRTARRLMLAAQGLNHPPTQAATKNDVIDTIRRMGMLQIDTIHVVARSPYLVLWSRLGDYDPHWLDELLTEKAIFEYWSHAACFLPIEDYPLYRRLMLDGRTRWNESPTWLAENATVAEQVIEHIRAHGETRSADFKRTDLASPHSYAKAGGQKGGWWNWKAEKIALEVLFHRGDLMIARRHNFQRIYDLRERVLPNWKDGDAPPYAEVQRALTLKAIRALGIATIKWLADYFYTPVREMPEVVQKLIDDGEIVPVEVKGWEPAYIHRDAFNQIDALTKHKPTLTTLLSPFDPLINNRQRARTVFNFEYQIECYTPAAKRRYGYFTLPILHRGKLIGRLDPKARRSDRIFDVKSIHLEPGVKITDQVIIDLSTAIQACADWHNTPKVLVRKSNPTQLSKQLQEAFLA